MFLPPTLEDGTVNSAQIAKDRQRARMESRNSALRFVLIPVAMELGAHFCSLVLGWDWVYI
ncbi:unnamed protein product [Thelazia callipaeda]|uniref:MEIOC protein n=1 Tax=Thelazia callipaeda TaxID=103827 RepID=A0A0N5CLM4_THECL|nr:unnamed protein product [Thelazia callipaeda]